MTEKHIVKIIMTDFASQSMKRFITQKPENYRFISGQATEVAINHSDWKDKKRPFTFSSLNEANVLEFIIKIYPSHDGVTEKLSQLRAGDELILHDIFGKITYKGSGVFIAGGAGITPFLSILRDLKEKDQLQDNTLLFSNKTAKDIILEEELKDLLGDKAIFTLTRENNPNYRNGRINKDFIKQYVSNFDQYFYICGPMQFIVDMKKALDELGVLPEKVVIEM